MFRGFRWQLLTLLLSTIIFSAALAFRISRQTTFPTRETPVPSPAQDVNTAVPSPTALSTAPSASVSLPAPDSFPGYREGLVGSLKRINPLFAHLNSVDRDISSLVFEGLFATNEYGAPVPRLAQDLVMSSDGLEYVVELRAGVRWQDGVPFTANDVAFTLSLLSDPDYAEYSSAAQFWATVETQILTEHLVRFRLAQPLASFTNLLSIGLLPEHALRGTSVAQLARHPFNLSPIGTGPYQVASFSVDEAGDIQSVQLQLSPIFQERLASPAQFQIRELRFQMYASPAEALDAYRAGRVDALSNVVNRAQLLALPNARLYTQLESQLTLLIFNWDNEQFRDRRTRQALMLAVDSRELIENHFPLSATVADSPIVPGLAAYKPGDFWTAFDLDRAATLFAAASGAADDDPAGSSGAPAESEEPESGIRLLVQNIAPLPALAEDISSNWRSLGLRVAVNSVEPDEYNGRLRSGDFDAAVVTQRIGSDPDLYRFWHPAQEETGFNFGGVDSDVISELLEAIRQERNGVVRQSLLQSFQEQFAEQAIALPLFYSIYTMAVRDEFEGIRLGYLGTAADRYRGIAEWRRPTITG